MTHPLLDAAHALVPMLAAQAGETDAARRVSDATLAAYRDAGILRALQPRRFGGHQASFGVFSRIVEILAEGCAASAWVYAVLGEHQWILACMPERRRRTSGRRRARGRVVLAGAQGNGAGAAGAGG